MAAVLGALGGWLGLAVSYEASVHHGLRLAVGRHRRPRLHRRLRAWSPALAGDSPTSSGPSQRYRREDVLDSFQSTRSAGPSSRRCSSAPSAGVVGVHVVLRRLPFFVVAMSHATFPGVVLASVLGVSLFVGGTAFGAASSWPSSPPSARSRVLDDSSAIGVVLAGAFAVGVLVLSAQPGSSQDLSAFLVGSILTVRPADVVATVVGGGVCCSVARRPAQGARARCLRPGRQRRPRLPGGRLDTLVLVAVTVTMVTTIPAVGTLLAVALLTVPALTAGLWTDRVGSTMAVAAVVGAASGVLGLAASTLWSIAAGGAIGLAAAGIFAASLAVRAVADARSRSRARAVDLSGCVTPIQTNARSTSQRRSMTRRQSPARLAFLISVSTSPPICSPSPTGRRSTTGLRPCRGPAPPGPSPPWTLVSPNSLAAAFNLSMASRTCCGRRRPRRPPSWPPSPSPVVSRRRRGPRTDRRPRSRHASSRQPWMWPTTPGCRSQTSPTPSGVGRRRRADDATGRRRAYRW